MQRDVTLLARANLGANLAFNNIMQTATYSFCPRILPCLPTSLRYMFAFTLMHCMPKLVGR